MHHSDDRYTFLNLHHVKFFAIKHYFSFVELRQQSRVDLNQATDQRKSKFWRDDGRTCHNYCPSCLGHMLVEKQ